MGHVFRGDAGFVPQFNEILPGEFHAAKKKMLDQSFLLYGQMVLFLHRLLQQVFQQVSLAQESDWDSLKSFDFVRKRVLSNEQL